MSNVLKNNFYFFMLWFILLHISGININIFRNYWTEKRNWGDSEKYWVYEVGYNYQEHQKYDSIRFYNLSTEIYEGWVGLFHLVMLGVLLIFYIISPLLVKKISFKNLLIIDVFVFIFFTFIMLKLILYKPMIGVIPIYVFNPTMILILIYFRIYQYKKKLIF